MRRILSVCLLLYIVASWVACKKSEIFGPVQYAAQAAADDDTIAAYLSKYGLTKVFKHVENNDTIGVFYRVIDSGATNTLYTNSTQITVGDTGYLLKLAERKGPLFYKTDSIHPSYALGSLIKGWQLGVPEVGSGGEVEVIMASRYAYGHYAQAQSGIPANAILDFYIRLYDVTN